MRLRPVYIVAALFVTANVVLAFVVSAEGINLLEVAVLLILCGIVALLVDLAEKS